MTTKKKGWGGSNLSAETRRKNRDDRQREMLREIVAHDGEFYIVASDESAPVRALVKSGLVEANGKNASGRTRFIATAAGVKEAA